MSSPQILSSSATLLTRSELEGTPPGEDRSTSRRRYGWNKSRSNSISVWDLLNQRRALREFGADPNQAQVRDEDTVAIQALPASNDAYH